MKRSGNQKDNRTPQKYTHPSLHFIPLKTIYGRVPRLLVPSTVGVLGSPAAIGVITGTAAPMNSVTLLLVPLTPSHTSPEPSTAIGLG
jgi:hypothetical protein